MKSKSTTKQRILRPGDIVTALTLKKTFDAYFESVINSYIEPVSRQRREQRKYKILKVLPTYSEYKALLSKTYTVSLDSLISDAYSVIEELQSEMQEVFDNMPENLQDSDLGQRRSECADSLDNLNDLPHIPEDVAEITTVYLPHLDQGSRVKRASDAVDMLSMAAAAIRGEIESRTETDGIVLEPITELADADGEEKPMRSEASDLEELADKLENDSQELDGIEFPGMYG